MWRYKFTLFFFIVLFFIILARLFYWQVIKAEKLSSEGIAQYGKFVKILPERGEIQTTDGYSLSTNKLTYLVYANTKEISNKEAVTLKLSPLLEIETASLSAALAYDRFWISLKRNISKDTKEKIEKLNIPGIGFEQSYTRFYPEASVGAHLLGFVGKDSNGDDKGYFGLEGYYDRQLRGKPGVVAEIHDALGKPIVAKLQKKSREDDGLTLVTNIDRIIQFIVESKLKDGIDKYGAQSGMAAVIDPKTGNVLAMASFPKFDPSAYAEYPLELYSNPFISSLYEPGSTFKALVMAAAIDAKVVTAQSPCAICEGPISVGGYEIRTWNNKYEKDRPMIDVIRYSDNIGMVFTSRQLGIDAMLSYFKRFGIGELTNIDLQGEATSEIKPKDSWYPIDIATASFGQGISVTGLQLLSAFASIGNNGIRMQPRVVRKIISSEGSEVKIEPKILGRPISETTAKVMTEILVNAVDKGEAKWTKPKGYRIAGKTGTAQIPIGGRYDPNKTIASFIGFAPADNPKFAMLVVVNRPTTSIYGAETAAPIFFDIAKEILTYFRVPSVE